MQFIEGKQGRVIVISGGGGRGSSRYGVSSFKQFFG
jgi:hypothetical protein